MRIRHTKIFSVHFILVTVHIWHCLISVLMCVRARSRVVRGGGIEGGVACNGQPRCGGVQGEGVREGEGR